MMFEELFEALGRNSSLVQLVIEAVEHHGISRPLLIAEIQRLLKEASDVQMKAELPEGS